ncbi:MAG: prephenate dehydratase [Nitrospinae bacterium CG11_big_fil_rev_8_21_14_0_20_56_8]|nr:MAG: prephenate dehydratase [Nitrospinae bacterium CG11_big_fil_rev_8_21_14_0_20_56_8]
MRQIDLLREQIDKIDDQILKLINRRATLAIHIGREKSRINAANHFHVPQREREIIDRLKQINEGPFPNAAVESVFREVFSATLALEKPLRIAHLGPETTFTHQAAIKQFGHSARFLSCNSIESVFSYVEAEKADYGVVPIENSIEGVINLTLDCFVDSPLVICDETKLPIALYLLSKSGKASAIKEIHSHPQPLAQCRIWLNRNMPNVPQVPASSTAAAAGMAARRKDTAAIAGKLAAEMYQLKIVAENIQDRAENHTRFLVIGKEPVHRAKRNKTSVMFSIKDEAGSLLKTLQLFARNKINLTKIQSRPLRNRPWEYLFYLDFEGHREDPTVTRVLETLRKRCLFMKVLGSYPKKA